MSQPSTRIMNPNTIAIVIQYARWRSSPVRQTASSTTTTATADANAIAG